jgi:CubicO group peptidase (beta-lactamase class C family)
MKQVSLLVVLLLLWPGQVHGQELDTAALDALIDKARQEHEAPGVAVALVKDGKVVYLQGFGLRKLGSDEKVTPDTIFAIASCTKAFTATGVAMLVDDGKLAWDDPVRKHLESFHLTDPLADREVTVRDLLCHRSGMPRHDWLWLGSEWNQEELIRRFGQAQRSTSFRSTWEYSNIPFTTAGYILGKLEGTTWADVMHKRIFTPLGMKTASCNGKELVTAKNVAQPHVLDKNFKLFADSWEEPDNLSALGAGAINASARDMAQWVRFNLGDGTWEGKRLLKASTLKELHTAQTVVRREGRWKQFFPDKATDHLAYGLGWFVHDHRGHFAVSHGGTLSGFRSQVMLAPKDHCGVVVLVNRGGTFLPEALAKTLMDRLLNLPEEDWLKQFRNQQKLDQFNRASALKLRASLRKKDTKPSLPLDGYVGIFEEPAYGKLEIRREGEGLQLAWASCVAKLEHYHYDTFTATLIGPVRVQRRMPALEMDVVFRLNAKGEVESVLFLEQEFKRTRKTTK